MKNESEKSLPRIIILPFSRRKIIRRFVLNFIKKKEKKKKKSVNRCYKPEVYVSILYLGQLFKDFSWIFRPREDICAYTGALSALFDPLVRSRVWSGFPRGRKKKRREKKRFNLPFFPPFPTRQFSKRDLRPANFSFSFSFSFSMG